MPPFLVFLFIPNNPFLRAQSNRALILHRITKVPGLVMGYPFGRADNRKIGADSRKISDARGFWEEETRHPQTINGACLAAWPGRGRSVLWPPGGRSSCRVPGSIFRSTRPRLR